MSYIAFVPGRDVGIFVAVSRVDFTMFFGLTAAANQLLASLASRWLSLRWLDCFTDKAPFRSEAA
jgi:hypothetical protein